MLKVTIPAVEEYNSQANLFSERIPKTDLTLEHSLVSISKWESKYNKPFIGTTKTHDESVYYIKCMTLTQKVNPEVYDYIPSSVFKEINDYIEAPMTATTITSRGSGSSKKLIITSELIYYWMVAFNIPFECQKWHLNRLIMLIRICDEKNKPKKKMSSREIMERNNELNAQRRAQLQTKG